MVDEDEYVNEGLPWTDAEMDLVEKATAERGGMELYADLSFRMKRSIDSIRHKSRQLRLGIRTTRTGLSQSALDNLQSAVPKMREAVRRRAAEDRLRREHTDERIALKVDRDPRITSHQAVLCIQHAAMMAAKSAEHPDLSGTAYAVAVEDFLDALSRIEGAAG